MGGGPLYGSGEAPGRDGTGGPPAGGGPGGGPRDTGRAGGPGGALRFGVGLVAGDLKDMICFLKASLTLIFKT